MINNLIPLVFSIISVQILCELKCVIHSLRLRKMGCFSAKIPHREPSEVQNILVIPAQDHTEMTVKCTYIEIPQVPHTYEIFISQPYWIWGAEMGVNEFGVCIGNENNFSKGKLYPNGKYLLGMDLLRLALERSQTAQEVWLQSFHYWKNMGKGDPTAP